MPILYSSTENDQIQHSNPNSKAFDRIDCTKLITILQNIAVDWRDRKLIWNLYNKQVACVRIEDGLSSAWQGCSLSPLLCLVYDEAMIREATDIWKLVFY